MYFLVVFQREGKTLASDPLGEISGWLFGHGGSWGIFIPYASSWDCSAGCRMSAETHSMGQRTRRMSTRPSGMMQLSELFLGRCPYPLGQTNTITCTAPHCPIEPHGHIPHDSPDPSPPFPPHFTSQKLLRAGCGRLLCSLVALLVLFLSRHPLSQTQAGPRTSNYSISLCFHMLQSVMVVLVVVMKVVVMVTPFSPSGNSAGFLSMQSVCECASYSCSPFKNSGM